MPCASRIVLVVLARVRAALVGVVQQTAVGTAPLQRHLERLDRQMPVVHRADRPADDEPREQIEDHRQVELAAAADDELGGVADPPLIRRGRLELPVEQIGGHRLVVIAHRRRLVALAHPRLQAFFLHQPHDALAADGSLLLDQVLVHARTAVPLPARFERRAHQDLQAAILAGACRLRPTAPRVEPARRDVQTPTEDRDG